MPSTVTTAKLAARSLSMSEESVVRGLFDRWERVA